MNRSIFRGVVAGLAAVGMSAAASPGQGHAHGHAEVSRPPAMEQGLAVTDRAHTLVLETRELQASATGPLRFHLEDAGGRPVTAFDAVHERRMHLIVVRRDLTQYFHLHPTMDASGRWSIAFTPPAPGVYRVYTDYTSQGTAHTLSTDLLVPGTVQSSSPPVVAAPEGYAVSVEREGDAIAFTLRYRGAVVAGVEPYLGALGHLVVLREGDLAFVHAHPLTTELEGGLLRFHAPLAPRVPHRAFLEFNHRGTVRTVEVRLDGSQAGS